MNIAVLSYDHVEYYLTQQNSRIFPISISSSNNIEKDFARLCLSLEEKIFLNHLPVDMVITVLSAGVRIDTLEKLDNTYSIHIIGDDDNFVFYCSPKVLFLLGSLYKINFTNYQINTVGLSKLESFFAKLIYVSKRLGIVLNDHRKIASRVNNRRT